MKLIPRERCLWNEAERGEVVLENELLWIYLLLLMGHGVESRRHRKSNEVGVVNLANANVRLRCQSVLVDHHDHFLAPSHQFRFRFVDIDRGNHHFWCDSYGLFDFFETFDVYGRAAPSRANITWFIKQDGLYVDTEQNRVLEWVWNYAPFNSYAED